MKGSIVHSNNGFTLPTEPTDESGDEHHRSNGWKRKAKSRVSELCTFELLRRRLPILIWLPTYDWDSGVYDIIAGITVGLTTIPQGIAYAAVAGLPLQVNKISNFNSINPRRITEQLNENSIDSI